MYSKPVIEASGLTTYLKSIFPQPLNEPGETYIEIRLLSDVQKDKCHGQRWYTSVDDVLNDLGTLNVIASEKNACVAISPALRREKAGTKQAVLGSWCVWNDQNERDGGQQACLQRLRDDDLSFLIVNSGYAAHGYLLLKEFCADVGKIELANDLLRKRLGGDAVHDAGRVMRLPGTMNRKKPDAPKPCHVVEGTERRYDIDELIELLQDEPEVAERDGQEDLLSKDAQVAAQHDESLGRLNPATVALIFEQVREGDRSEHDLAVMNSLVAEDFTDEEIRAVFSRYPCGEKARENGFDKYLNRTLATARRNGHLFLPARKSIPRTPQQLQRQIGDVRATEKTAPARQEATAQAVLDFFDHHGKFFTDGVSTCHLHFEGESCTLSDNRRFRSLLQAVCGLSLENKDGKLTLDRLANHALRHGQVATTRGPVFVNRQKHAVFVHPGGDSGDILRITSGQVERVGNGTNDDRVCLVAPPELQAFEYEPDVDVRTALDLYRSTLIDWLACDEIDRLTLMLWLPNVFLLNYSTVKIVMKASGPQSSGKTAACRLLGTLITGSDVVKIRPTAPSIYADPLPLQILDNVENRDLRRSLEDIILFAATGGAREKMKLSADNERIRHEINCLLLLNGIESLDRSEILSRVYEVQFDREHQRSGFLETDVLDGLLASRSTILSGLLRLLADQVLPRIAAGEIKQWKDRLDARHGNHPKQRSFEFLARMGLIADSMVQVQHPEMSPGEAYEAAWMQIESILNRQASSANEADAETNALAHLIHALVAEKRHWNHIVLGPFPSRFHIEIDIDADAAHITATASELHYALSTLAKHAGIRGLEVRNPRSLSARLASDRSVLQQCGIDVDVTGQRNKTNVYSLRVS